MRGVRETIASGGERQRVMTHVSCSMYIKVNGMSASRLEITKAKGRLARLEQGKDGGARAQLRECGRLSHSECEMRDITASAAT